MNEIQKKLLKIIGDLSKKEIDQVITFAEFLLYKRNNETEEVISQSIEKNIGALKDLSKYD